MYHVNSWNDFCGWCKTRKGLKVNFPKSNVTFTKGVRYRYDYVIDYYDDGVRFNACWMVRVYMGYNSVTLTEKAFNRYFVEAGKNRMNDRMDKNMKPYEEYYLEEART